MTDEDFGRPLDRINESSHLLGQIGNPAVANFLASTPASVGNRTRVVLAPDHAGLGDVRR